MTLEVRQSAAISKRRPAFVGEDPSDRIDFYDWAIWIAGDDDELDRVKEVRYSLHPTFVRSEHVVRSRENGFRLSASGWGEFRIVIAIRFSNGETDERSHWLRLFTEEKARAPDGTPYQAARLRPQIFVSAAASDAGVVAALREALGARDVRVRSVGDLRAGLPWERALERVLDECRAMVAVVPERQLRAVEREVAMAERSRIPVLPLVIEGRTGELPGWVRARSYLTTADGQKLEASVIDAIRAAASAL